MPKLSAARTIMKHANVASTGRCPVCGHLTAYVLLNAENPREGYVCVRCRSLPRNRLVALGMLEVLRGRDLRSAAKRGLNHDVYLTAATGALADALGVGTPRLTTSEYKPSATAGGVLSDGVSTCQNLECLRYADESFDVVVTEDVLEHVRDVDACHSEIRRVLRPGGRHVFSVPFRPDEPHLVRVDTEGPEDVLLMEEEWHGDAVRGKILSYRRFGYDIFESLGNHGFQTRMLRPTLANRRAGIGDTFAFVAMKTARGRGHRADD